MPLALLRPLYCGTFVHSGTRSLQRSQRLRPVVDSLGACHSSLAAIVQKYRAQSGKRSSSTPAQTAPLVPPSFSWHPPPSRRCRLHSTSPIISSTFLHHSLFISLVPVFLLSVRPPVLPFHPSPLMSQRLLLSYRCLLPYRA